MTVEKLRERIAVLEQDKQSAFASFNAIHGALQEARHWLAELQKSQEQDK